MISVFLNGLLSSTQENMEDILTSCVFDLLRYSSTPKILIDWLKQAKSLDNRYPLNSLSDQAVVEIDFWPSLSEPGCIPCIPDVLLKIQDHSVQYLVLVEAKFRSGKSSLADINQDSPSDQLAREWDNLASYSKREGFKPRLIYLTASVEMPRLEMKESLSELGKKREIYDGEISWLSWRHLFPLVQKNNDPAISDLAALLNRLDLYMFDGIHRVRDPSGKQWCFDPLDSPFWSQCGQGPRVNWGYKNGN